ncbi:MAG: patatin-like phospholipase family protein [Clostridia bacterium]|nr:patatin-like phospholipase family protein [Clostridia bacterium]
MKNALVLSGGGSRGAYEIGVWQALREMGIKIDIVCGTSIGAMNSAVIAQGAFEEGKKIWLGLKTDEVFDYKHAIENKGVKFTTIKDYLDDYLSEEDIRQSPIEMGVVVVEFPSMVPHHYWKEDIPKGKLMDYVFASCSCFPVVMPYEIDGKAYVDGGFSDYMPVSMALEKNADRIICVNLDADMAHKLRKNDLEAAKDRLFYIKPAWDLGNFAIFNPSNSEDIMRLGYLDTLKAFGAYTGKKYTFMRGQIPAREIKQAEIAAEIFGLDHKIIYSKEIFDDCIVRAIDEAGNKIEKTRAKIDAVINPLGLKLPNKITKELDDMVESIINTVKLDEQLKKKLKKLIQDNKKSMR